MSKSHQTNNTQIIVARFNENLDWITSNNYTNRCLVYNKGYDNLSPRLNIIKKPNYPIYGREGETYLYHIVHNYHNLSDYIIFTQGNPFEHSPHFIRIIDYLDSTNSYKPYQPLTSEWKTSENVPPKGLLFYDKTCYVDKYPVYMETLDENLNTLFYNDLGWHTREKQFRNFHKIPTYSKLFPILPFVYEKLNLHKKKPYTSFVKFNWGAIFGVSKENILQYSIDFYKHLYRFVIQHPTHGYILERMWYTILC